MTTTKKLTKVKIKEILELHLKWKSGKVGGSGADLSGADLSGADLNGAFLIGAILLGTKGLHKAKGS